MKKKTVIRELLDDLGRQFSGHGLDLEKKQIIIDYLEHYCKRKNITLLQNAVKVKQTARKQIKRKLSPPSNKKLSNSEHYRQFYLRSPIWKKQRSEVIKNNRQNNNGVARCEACGASEITTTLDVHHSVYRERNMNDPQCIKDKHVMCRSCHKEIHDIKKANKSMSLRKATDVLIQKYSVANDQSIVNNK